MKDNKKTLNIPEEYFTDPKIKSLKLATFSTSLPLIKGPHVPKGDLYYENFKGFDLKSPSDRRVLGEPEDRLLV